MSYLGSCRTLKSHLEKSCCLLWCHSAIQQRACRKRSLTVVKAVTFINERLHTDPTLTQHQPDHWTTRYMPDGHISFISWYIIPTDTWCGHWLAHLPSDGQSIHGAFRIARVIPRISPTITMAALRRWYVCMNSLVTLRRGRVHQTHHQRWRQHQVYHRTLN